MNYSAILRKAYQQFILKIGDKKVPIPYRINIPPEEHPVRQGKSSPEDILNQLIWDAKDQNFDLTKSSVEEVREFMIKNKLGIDCSGFAYRMLDFLVHQTKGKHLTNFGFDNVGRTNVNALTSDQFSDPVLNFSQVKPGDIIKANSEKKIPHCMIVLEKTPQKIIYAHSTGKDKQNGVVIGETKNLGDGVRRLKLWSAQ